MAQEQRGFVHAPEEGKAFWFLGALVIIMLTSEQTENAFALQISTQPPGSGPPPHLHHEQDETLHILEGTATITCGNQTWSASPGDYVFLTTRHRPYPQSGRSNTTEIGDHHLSRRSFRV